MLALKVIVYIHRDAFWVNFFGHAAISIGNTVYNQGGEDSAEGSGRGYYTKAALENYYKYLTPKPPGHVERYQVNASSEQVTAMRSYLETRFSHGLVPKNPKKKDGNTVVHRFRIPFETCVVVTSNALVKADILKSAVYRPYDLSFTMQGLVNLKKAIRLSDWAPK